MDFAAAIALTATVLVITSILVIIVSAVIASEYNGRKGALAMRGVWTGASLFGVCVLLYIVAIWLGFAQSAAAS